MIKDLKAKLNLAKSNLEMCEIEAKGYKSEIQSLSAKIRNIKKLEKAKRDGFIITDHALIRHMARVAGLDVEIIRESLNQMLQDKYKGGDCINVDNVSYKLVDNKVTTVY